MDERRSINPSRAVLSDAKPFFYPITNTPPVDLCKDIAPRESADPFTVCLLGAGDVRNVFLTTHQRRKRGDKRKLKFYVNDHNPAIIARDILLLTLAAQTPKKGRRLDHFVEFFVHVYADLALTGDNRTRIDAALEDLIANFVLDGSSLTVTEQDQLWYVKKTWALWLTDRQKIRDVNKMREAKNKRWVLERSHRHEASRPVPGSERSNTMRDSDLDLFVEFNYNMVLMSNCDLAATPTMREEVSKYYKSGNIGGQSPTQNRLNPTLFDPETKEFPHYFTNPFQLVASTTEEKDYSDEEQTLLATLTSCFKRLLSRFALEMRSGTIQVLFDVGDCNLFLSERLSTETTFHVIDTSNLADNLGLMNLLLLGIPRLNSNDPDSILWTQTLKAHVPYNSLDAFLQDSLGFRYSVISTMLQTECTVPFESASAFDEESGRASRSNLAAGLLLKWKRSLSITPNILDLAPRPDACFFRQFVDCMLLSIYDSYTGRLHKVTQGSTTIKADLPREFTMTVSTLLHVLCQAVKTLKRPRQVFDYLYQKVKFRRVPQPVTPGETIWGVFALDVQMSASLICPDQYKPSEPLHPLLASQSLETRRCRLSHSNGRLNHPTPILGWLLMEDYEPFDGVLFQTMLAGLSAKTISASTTAGNLQQLSQLTDNVFSYIEGNVYRLQFIDSVSTSFPDYEALVTLPSSLFSSYHSYALVGVSTLDGTFLYSPLTDREFRAATTVSLQTQMLQYSDPAVEGPETSSDETRVSALREYHDRFDAIITSEKPFKATWKLTSENIGLQTVTLRIGDPSTNGGTNITSTCVSLCLPTHVELHSAPRLLDFIDERKVKVSLPKLPNALHPTVQKIELELLDRWPVNRPLGVGMSMFTVEEVSTSSSRAGVPFGHDSYFDARQTVFVMYNAFIDQTAKRSRGILKLREDRKKLFHAVSSLEKGFIAYTPPLLITSMGTPVIEVHYIYSTDPTPPEVDQFLAFIQSRQGSDHELTTTRGSDDEMDLLRSLLERNAVLLKDVTQVTMGGVTLNRSFFVPIYPKGSRLGEQIPRGNQPEFMEILDRWRQQNLPSSITDSLQNSDLW
jgi:hypothetical protein